MRVFTAGALLALHRVVKVVEHRADSPNLDLLRTVAVSLVVSCHLMLVLATGRARDLISPIGRVGVLLFFVHTTLVLMLSMARQRREGPWWLEFYLRRAFRIFPLSILAVLGIYLFGWPVAEFVDGHFVGASVSGAGLAANLFLVQNLTDTPSVLTTLWSLPYEVQMYAVLPALFVLSSKRWQLLSLWALAVVVGRTGHGFLAFVPCFLAGVVAFHFSHTFRRRIPGALFLPFLGALVVAYTFRENGWLICGLLGLMLPLFRESAFAPLNRVCQYVAKYSYGVYLTHFVALWLAFEKLGALGTPAKLAIFAAVTMGSSVLLYHLVEDPMIRAGRLLTTALRGKRSEVPARVAVAPALPAPVPRAMPAPVARALDLRRRPMSRSLTPSV